jgi:signal transduction histidine kinase
MAMVVTMAHHAFQTMAFHFFLMWVHYMRENAERRLYVLRDQLKLQYKATQKAQINERKAADSKRRLTSYVFHEVRVPLNTALLAVQNMAAVGVFARSQDIGKLADLPASSSVLIVYFRVQSARGQPEHDEQGVERCPRLQPDG